MKRAQVKELLDYLNDSIRDYDLGNEFEDNVEMQGRYNTVMEGFNELCHELGIEYDFFTLEAIENNLKDAARELNFAEPETYAPGTKRSHMQQFNKYMKRLKLIISS